MITQNITEEELNFIFKLKDDIKKVIDIFLIKENENNIKTDIKEIKFKFENFSNFNENSFNTSNIENFLYFFFNDFSDYLINGFVIDNYKNSLTTNEKNMIIDCMINNYANDLFFQNILNCEIYNNPKANNIYEIKNYLYFEKSHKYNFLTNKTIGTLDIINNRLFTQKFINFLKYIDENNLNSHCLKVMDKINFNNIKNKNLKENLLNEIFKQMDCENNINFFNIKNDFLMNNNFLNSVNFEQSIWHLDIDAKSFIKLIISDDWLKFENYILNLNDKERSFPVIYLEYFVHKISHENNLNTDDYFKFYDNLIKKTYNYKNDNHQQNLILLMINSFDTSFENEKNVNELLYQYLNKYFINENTNIISPIMVFNLIGNNAKYYSDKTISYTSDDYYYDELKKHIENSFINIKLDNLNQNYNQLLIDINNLFINYPDTITDVINSVLVYRNIMDKYSFSINNNSIIQNNDFYKKHSLEIDILNNPDIKLSDVIKIINQDNIDENSKLILKDLYNYLNKEMAYLHYKNREDFISLFLQNIHFNFLTINDDLNKELNKIDFSKNFLKNYANLIKIDEYNRNVTKYLNNAILKSDKVIQDKCEIIKNNIKELYQVSKNKRLKI